MRKHVELAEETMKAILWGVASGVLGLLWFMVEGMSGRLQAGSSIETPVMWLVLTPLVAVGAMVQQRRMSTVFTYMQAVRVGVVASIWSALSLLIVWIVITTILVPEYQSYIEAGITMRVIRAGENVQQLAQRIKFSRMIYTPPTLYVVSTLIPLVVGSLTSCIAAIGLKTKTEPVR